MKNTSIQHLAKLAALLVCLCTLGHAVVVAVEHGLVAPGSKGTYRGRPDIAAVRIDQVPVIDGHLIDEVWELAQPAGEFLQKEPKQNIPHSQRTEFRVIYNDDALFIGVWCFDTEAGKIIAHTMERDVMMRYEDMVNITLDTFQDRRNGYVFTVNPNGARGDATVSNNTSRNGEWDGAWTAKCRKYSWGWSAEVAIPFKSLSFDGDNNIWGINIYRNIGRSGERGQWANSRRTSRSYHVSECGNLTGLRDLKQGMGLDITPYLTGKFRKDYNSSDSDLLGDFGTDIRYRLTPSLTALASINTDFAETEIDSRQLNLSRFPLFFPEKRQFFLEDSGIFGFGGGESSRRRSSDSSDALLMPFFSRRIGLSTDGRITPIQFAGKLTGRIKDYNVGILDAVVDGDNNLRNAFVGRVSRNVFEQSSFGFLTTIGDPNSDNMNSLTGVDFQYRNTDFMGGHTFEVNLYTLGSYTEGTGGMEPAWATNAKLYDRNIELSASVIEIGRNFNPAMGFVRRRGTRRHMLEADFTKYFEEVSWLRNTRHGYEAELYTDLGNDVVNTQQTFNLASLSFESQELLSLSVSHFTDRPIENFDISDGTLIPSGNYDWWNAKLSLNTGLYRKLAAANSYTVGGFYDGDRQQISSKIIYRPTKRISVALNYSLNLIDWEHFDDSVINLVSGRFQYSFTPDLTLYNLVQYDDISHSIGLNSRLQWEYKPGAKMFLVLNQGYVDGMTGFVISDLEVVAKIGALFRF